ncbi:hypothetical protein B0G69_4219 [Paraburkholderia sp. RAU2J]|nr:hypothetical protein B0G69_4219 [Paraburkholderia sp. RAU2J]
MDLTRKIRFYRSALDAFEQRKQLPKNIPTCQAQRTCPDEKPQLESSETGLAAYLHRGGESVLIFVAESPLCTNGSSNGTA